ncbi:MAG TPA: hypothetical protein VGO82_06300 [Enterovirga sp.]|jgi:hypothetical protein|nr:hypothetical protein [Enterovirga sp.]
MTNDRHVREHDPFSGHAPVDEEETPVPELGPTPPPPADPLPPVPAVAATEEPKKAPVRRGRKPRRTVSKPAAK